jgi:hypothetical protein
METQSGARTPLVDPFGRELEAWLRDAPATRTPYLADLVVPPVTGPVQRPDVDPAAAAEVAPDAAVEVAPADTAEPAATTELAATTDDTAFRRPRNRDRARHVATCAPSFPEPPERLALRIEDLAVEVSASSGRTTIERIVILEDEVRRRDEDLARLAAWEATVAHVDDPEAEAARDFARTVFADLLADAALEADRRDRAAARRAGTAPVAVVVRAPERSVAAAPQAAPALVPATEAVDAIDGAAPAVTDGSDRTAALQPASARRELPVRPVLGLQAVTPVSANTRPTPLVQPATGPTVIDRAAFAAALTAHQGATASTPVVLPEAVSVPVTTAAGAMADAAPVAAGWWSRFVDRVLRALGRR